MPENNFPTFLAEALDLLFPCAAASGSSARVIRAARRIDKQSKDGDLRAQAAVSALSKGPVLLGTEFVIERNGHRFLYPNSRD
jgi:hypothetical protein